MAGVNITTNPFGNAGYHSIETVVMPSVSQMYVWHSVESIVRRDLGSCMVCRGGVLYGMAESERAKGRLDSLTHVQHGNVVGPTIYIQRPQAVALRRDNEGAHNGIQKYTIKLRVYRDVVGAGAIDCGRVPLPAGQRHRILPAKSGSEFSDALGFLGLFCLILK